MEEITYPEKFPSLIIDFTSALTTTFPEYASLWSMYSVSTTTEEQWLELYQYCLEVYPENFFNILYQNEDMFAKQAPSTDTNEKTINMFFLPNVDFSRLYHASGVSETTRNSIWKYIQLILFTVVGSVKDTDGFGTSANLFEGIDENELQSKLTEAMGSIGDFFKDIESNLDSTTQNCEKEMNNVENEMKQSFAEFAESFAKDEGENVDMGKAMKEGMENMEKMFEKVFGEDDKATEQTEQKEQKEQTEDGQQSKFTTDDLPNADNIHDHLKGLFGGKLGALASELMEELTGDLQETFGLDPETMSETADTKDIFKTLMRNPQKFMGIVQKINSKFQGKMQSGELSQEDIMKEAGDMIKKMKDMGGNSKEMKQMFQNMAQTMGGGDMGNLANMFGKNARIDTNALDRMTKMQTTKDRIRAKLAKKKQESEEQRKQQEYTLSQSADPNQLVYRHIDGETQERSAIRPITNKMTEADLDKLVQDIEGSTEDPAKSKSKSKSKSKNKKKAK